MNNNKALLLLIGIGMILLFLTGFIWSKSPLDLFNSSLGVMIILFIFYNEDKKINYLITLFFISIFQWLILIYIFFNNLFYYIKTDFYCYLIGATLFTIVLANQIHKDHLKTEINILKNKKKLMLLFTGLTIIIGCLACFIIYYAPIFIYGITLGLLTFIYGFYHENNKVNISVNYAGAMGSVFILQWFIIVYFIFTRQFSGDDFVNSVSFSIMITLLFLIQIRESELKYIGRMRRKPTMISNEKKENIIGICAVIAFILFFGALALKG